MVTYWSCVGLTVCCVCVLQVGYTHWGQQVLYLMEPVDCHADSIITGTVAMTRQEKNQRLYDVPFSYKLDDGEEHQLKYELP